MNPKPWALFRLVQAVVLILHITKLPSAFGLNLTYRHCFDPGVSDDCKLCTVDTDCDYATGLACRKNAASGGSKRGCECHAFFGFGGKSECKPGHSDVPELKSAARSANLAIIVGVVVALVMSIVFTTRCFQLWILMVRAGKFFHTLLRTSQGPAAAFSTISGMLSTFGSIGYLLTATQVDKELIFEKKMRPAIIGFGGLCSILACLSISSMWIDVAVVSMPVKLRLH